MNTNQFKDKIDLHLHSNYSDGTISPSGLIDIAINIGLYAIALVDHDTISGVKEFLNYRLNDFDNKIKRISGIEISTGFNGIEIHILGFWIDINSIHLINFIDKIQKDRKRRNIELLFNLKKIHGYDLSFNDLNNNGVVGRLNIASALVKKGYFNSIHCAFNKCLTECNNKVYISRKLPNVEDVINIIHNAGGIALWAHPFCSDIDMNKDKIEIFIRDLISFKIDGIEAYHSSCYKEQSNFLIKLANKYNLGVSGGSDFHGQNIPDTLMGSGKNNLLSIHKSIYYNLLNNFNKIKN